MRFIHCADIHLGSKMDSNLPREKADERRSELRATFVNLVNYAKTHKVEAILLCGDIFDSDRPFKKDKEFFYSVVRGCPEVLFFYLRGNHDGQESFTEELENLKTFSRDWKSYNVGAVTISAVELAGDNAQSIYSTLRLSPDSLNIVMLHGTAGDSSGKDKINLTKLREKNIDYLALGHIHTHGGFEKIDGRGIYAYSGCLEGRGFDEAGEKGFVLLDIDKKITPEFIPFAKRKIDVVKVDISAAADDYAAYKIVEGALSVPKTDIVRVELCGEIDFDNADLARETEKRLYGEGYYLIAVKDKTVRRFDLQKLSADLSLGGEFIRTVLASKDIPEEEKGRVISAGLKALAGREVDV